MLKTIGFACCVAMTSALKLQVDLEAQKMRGLNDYTGWSDNADQFKAILAAGTGKWSDPDFPANAQSVGGTVADTANTDGTTSSAGPKWKRLSEMFSADEPLKMFSSAETIYSNARQGNIGDCFLISTLASFDSRPGALESLFVSKTINDRGVYAMRFNFNGEWKVIVVDDQVPAEERWHQNKATGQWAKRWQPIYASSVVRGEIWPMIAEKAYAKVHGTYAAIGNGGQIYTALNQLSDDPSRNIMLRYGDTTYGYKHDNAKGNKLWADLLKWNAHEYMTFFGTDKYSWVKGHAYGLTWAKEITINGKKQKWIQGRNPWGSSKWVGANMSVDKTMYNRDWPELKKMAGFTSPPGSFEMPWIDFLKQADSVIVTYGQYKRDGTKQKDEYRSVAKIPSAASATSGKPFHMRITLQEPINLKQDWLNISAIQGGNRPGTENNKAFTKGTTGQFTYQLYNVNDQKSFTKEWGGYGVTQYRWSTADTGAHHLIDDSDGSAVMPAGTYLLIMTPTWEAYANSNPVLKEITMRIGSAAKLTADYLTLDQATRLSSQGWAKIAPNTDGKRCEAWNSMATAKGLTLKQVRDATVEKSKKYFYASPTMPTDTAWVCNEDPALADSSWWHAKYNVYEILDTANPLPNFDGSATPVVPPTPVVTPPATPQVAPAAATVTPAAAPVVSGGWTAPTDTNYQQVVAACQKSGFSPYGNISYRMTNMQFTVNGVLDSKYFCEETKNISGSAQKLTYKFDPKWKVVSHETNTVSAVLKDQETVLIVAKYVDPNTAFTWDLYAYNIVAQ